MEITSSDNDQSDTLYADSETGSKEDVNSEQILQNIKSNFDGSDIRDNLATVKLRQRTRKGTGKKRIVNVAYEIHIVNSQFMAKFNLVLGLLCMLVGIVIYAISTQLRYISIPYTDCIGQDNEKCKDVVLGDAYAECVCVISFNITNDITGNALVYYELNPFHQNYRAYVESRSDYQLLGNRLEEDNDLSSTCKPLDFRKGKEIAPCGAIANSIFNDTFTIERMKTINSSTVWIEMNIEENELVFDEITLNYGNPDPKDNLTAAFRNTTEPPNWQQRIEELGGYRWPRLMAWMNIEPFSNVVKMYGRIRNIATDGQLETGTYRLTIDYNYPLWTENAEKIVKIANTSFLGHRNFKLGYYFIAIGIYLVLSAAVFYWVYRNYDKPTKASLLKLGIHTKIDRGFTFHRAIND